MNARAVVADRCVDIGLECRSKREVAADAETHNTNFPWRDFRVYGKPVQTGAAIGIEMRNRSLRGVLLAAGPAGVIEGDHRSRRFDAPINFRRSSNKSVPGQPHASAQQWRSELKNIRVAPYAWILTFGPGRSDESSHRRNRQRNVYVFGGDYHLLVRENSGRDALASQFLNSRDGLLLTLTIYFPFPTEQFCIVVKVFAQQRLFSCFRFLLIFQDIKNCLIDHCQK